MWYGYFYSDPQKRSIFDKCLQKQSIDRWCDIQYYNNPPIKMWKCWKHIHQKIFANWIFSWFLWQGNKPKFNKIKLSITGTLYFIIQVDHLVGLHASLCTEPFSTNITIIWPFPSMYSVVSVKIRCGWKTTITHFTDIRLFPSMPPHVDFQISWGRLDCSTNVTFQRVARRCRLTLCKVLRGMQCLKEQ
jgi:hypothetical protein